MKYNDLLDMSISHMFSCTVLTWAIYYITTNPNVEQKLMEEVKSVLGDDDINHENIGDLL